MAPSSPAGSGPVQALWLPFEVTDLDAAIRYYTDRLALSVVDSWDHGTERGVVLAAGRAYVELVTADASRPGPPAFQLAGPAEVDRVHAGWARAGRPGGAVASPWRYPRGHYGFEATGPAGARVMVWSEDARS